MTGELIRKALGGAARRQAELSRATALIAGLIGAIVGQIVSEISGTLFYLLCAVAAVVGILAYLVQRRLRRDNGTFYYVSILGQEMKDQHAENVTILSGAYGAYCPVPARSNPREKFGMVDDFTSAVAEAKGRLIGRMDDDAPGTGFHVAPNMLWPSALSLGFDIDWPAGTELIELPPGLRLDAAKGAEPGDLVSWRIGAKRISDAVLANVTAHSIPPDPPKDASAVLIVAELTDRRDRVQQPWPVAATYRVGVFADDDSDGGALPVEVDTDPAHVVARRAKRQASADVVVVHPEEAARACYQVIRKVLHRHPDAVVLVNFLLPKAVSLRIGDLLQSEDRSPGDPGCGVVGCLNESCREPWSRLVPLLYDHMGKSYRIARVHDSQPTAPEIDSMLRALA